MQDMADSINVLGETLEPCSMRPMTGYYRNGCCDTGAGDHGSHTVCAIMTDAFLAYSKSVGNDLSTPIPAFEFPGLKDGDQWCICAARFLQAHEAGCAPRVCLESTHRNALEIVPLDILKSCAADLH